jgi:hypothetical protein
MFSKEFFAAPLSLFGEQNRFRLAHWIADQAFLVEPAHGIPVVTFPCATVAVEREKEEREHHLVDFVFVVVHVVKLPFLRTDFNRASIAPCGKLAAEPIPTANAGLGPAGLTETSSQKWTAPLFSLLRTPRKQGYRLIPIPRCRSSAKWVGRSG